MKENYFKNKLAEIFGKRASEFRENPNPHEIAREVRDVQLNVIDFGVIGSGYNIPNEPNRKATKLPVLLRYSPTIQAHFQTLRGVISQPREFQIVDEVDEPWRDDVPDGDVIFNMDGKNLVYYFASHLSSPYLNSWAAAFDIYQKREPFLCIAIAQENESKGGIWEMIYAFTDLDDGTSDNNVGMSNYYPERQMALQFWYSSSKLSAKYIFDKFPSSKKVKEYLSLVGEEEKGGFRQVIFHFDGKRYADWEEERHMWVDGLSEKYAAFLRKRGNFDFSIVEIGTTTLGGQKRWVYTGSEVARVEERSSQRVPNAVRQLAQKYG